MDTQAVVGVDSVIYTTSDLGMVNTFANALNGDIESREFAGGYEVDCTTPEQIATFFFLFGGDLKASSEAGQTKDMGKGRIVYDMNGTNAGVADIQYNYPVCYTPNVGIALGAQTINYFIPNTPENRQLFADAWLASDGQIDSDMTGLTNNGDGSPVYTTPDSWYGVTKIDGEEYFFAGNLPNIKIDLMIPGDVEMAIIEDEASGTYSGLCYRTVSPVYNVPLVIADVWDEKVDLDNLTRAILQAIGR